MSNISVCMEDLASYIPVTALSSCNALSHSLTLVRSTTHGKKAMQTALVAKNTWLWTLGNLMETDPHLTDNGIIKGI